MSPYRSRPYTILFAAALKIAPSLEAAAASDEDVLTEDPSPDVVDDDPLDPPESLAWPFIKASKPGPPSENFNLRSTFCTDREVSH